MRTVTPVVPTRAAVATLSKAKVEQAVLIVERWLLGRLRRRTFYSLADVDTALGELMTQLNETRPCAGSALPAASCSKRSIARRSRRCPTSPMSTASGACAGSGSTITSTSTPTITPSPTASPAPRSRRA